MANNKIEDGSVTSVCDKIEFNKGDGQRSGEKYSIKAILGFQPSSSTKARVFQNSAGKSQVTKPAPVLTIIRNHCPQPPTTLLFSTRIHLLHHYHYHCHQDTLQAPMKIIVVPAKRTLSRVCGQT